MRAQNKYYNVEASQHTLTAPLTPAVVAHVRIYVVANDEFFALCDDLCDVK